MRAILFRLVVVLCCTAFVACTSLRPVVDRAATQDSSLPISKSTLAANDALTVTSRDGLKVQLHLVSVTADSIEGTQDSDRQPRSFRLVDVVKIERREFDGVKTAFLVVLIAAGVYAIVQAIGPAAVLSGG